MTTAVDKWPACARLLAVAPAGHLPTALTPLLGTRPWVGPRWRSHLVFKTMAAAVRGLQLAAKLAFVSVKRRDGASCGDLTTSTGVVASSARLCAQPMGATV